MYTILTPFLVFSLLTVHRFCDIDSSPMNIAGFDDNISKWYNFLIDFN